MKEINVIALVGGVSKESLNRHVYDELTKINNTSLSFSTYDLSELSYYSQDIENTPPSVVAKFQQTIAVSDAVLFITPEYNRSLPGVLKNAIDWCSRPYGHNLWRKKPVAMMGASPGKIGTFGAQQHLKNILNFLDVRLMNQPEVYLDASSAIDSNGSFVPATVSFLQQYLATFEQWIIAQRYNYVE